MEPTNATNEFPILNSWIVEKKKKLFVYGRKRLRERFFYYLTIIYTGKIYCNKFCSNGTKFVQISSGFRGLSGWKFAIFVWLGEPRFRKFLNTLLSYIIYYVRDYSIDLRFMLSFLFRIWILAWSSNEMMGLQLFLYSNRRTPSESTVHKDPSSE